MVGGGGDSGGGGGNRGDVSGRGGDATRCYNLLSVSLWVLLWIPLYFDRIPLSLFCLLCWRL